MIKIRKDIIFLLLVICNNLFCQENKINSIVLGDSTFAINNTIIYSGIYSVVDDVKTFKNKIGKQKIIRVKEEKSQYSFYFINSGVELVSSRDKKSLINLCVHFKNLELSSIKINRKLKTYSGSLKIYSYDLNNNTTLGDLKKDARFNTCNKEDTNSIHLKCNSVFSFTLVFDGKDNESKLMSVYFGI